MFFRGVARNHQAEIYHPPALGKLVLFCHVLPATEVADPIRHKQLGDLALLVDSYFGSCTILYIHISMYTYIVCIYIYSMWKSNEIYRFPLEIVYGFSTVLSAMAAMVVVVVDSLRCLSWCKCACVCVCVHVCIYIYI